jgi:alkylated DNA repair dioxygenase AlkB
MYEHLSLTSHALDAQHVFYSGHLPSALILGNDFFDEVWGIHPDAYHEIQMHGRLVKTPRWQQAYGNDYLYSGRTNEALPVPSILQPLHAWCLGNIDEQLNGLLVNCYDGQKKHYIGKHRDSRTKMVVDSPIVTLSIGQERIFRLRPRPGSGFRDFPTANGSLFIMPYSTNLAWTHEVPHHACNTGRRISITLRCFN